MVKLRDNLRTKQIYNIYRGVICYVIENFIKSLLVSIRIKICKNKIILILLLLRIKCWILNIILITQIIL